MSPKVSIIMPVYNADKHLKEMLDSILGQKFADFELIAVDDGSTDTSLSILNAYVKQDNRLKVIHKTNSGVSDTRNQGLEIATGEFVCFVDADDILSPDYLKTLYEIAQEKNADMVVSSYQTFHTKLTFQLVEEEIKRNTDSMELINLGLLTTSWTKMIRLSVLKQYDILFPSGVTYGEDLFFCWKAYMVCKNVWLCNQKLYGYRLSGDSAIYRYHDKVYENYAFQFDRLREFAVQNEMEAEIGKIDFFFTKRLPTFLKMIVRSKSPFRYKIRDIKKIINDPVISRVLNKQWEAFQKWLQVSEYSLYRNAKHKKYILCLFYSYQQEWRMKLSALRNKFRG